MTWSEETEELLERIKGVEWLLERKGATSAQAQEWELWLVFLYEELDEQPDWIAWKKDDYNHRLQYNYFPPKRDNLISSLVFIDFLLFSTAHIAIPLYDLILLLIGTLMAEDLRCKKLILSLILLMKED
jgi:hypothetical protein